MKSAMLAVSFLMLVGCGTIEDSAPSKGHAAFESDRYAFNNCSLELLQYRIRDLKRLGFSAEYRRRFESAYQGSCDRYLEKKRRHVEACKNGTSLIPCP